MCALQQQHGNRAMGLVYDDNPPRSNGNPPRYDTQDANKGYLKHYANMLLLDFIAKSTKDFKEAAQARGELLIAERKMEYWKRHMNYDQATVTRGIEKIKAQWTRK